MGFKKFNILPPKIDGSFVIVIWDRTKQCRSKNIYISNTLMASHGSFAHLKPSFYSIIQIKIMQRPFPDTIICVLLFFETNS